MRASNVVEILDLIAKANEVKKTNTSDSYKFNSAITKLEETLVKAVEIYSEKEVGDE